MRTTVKIGALEVPLECNALTPIVYSAEFRVERSKGGGTRPEDINEAISAVMERMSDGGLPPMLPLMRLMWAFAKTADRALPGFAEWAAALPAEALDLTDGEGWASAVTQMVTQNFFPAATKLAAAPA